MLSSSRAYKWSGVQGSTCLWDGDRHPGPRGQARGRGERLLVPATALAQPQPDEAPRIVVAVVSVWVGTGWS